MRNLIVSASLIAAAVAVSGCATHETAKFDAAQSLGDGSSWDASYSSEQAGENSYSWGDKYTAANLFLQADKADNSIKNRFNLAAAFASIGKTGMAREIYASLVVDGRFTRLSEDTRQGDPTWTKSFNVGQNRRTDCLRWTRWPRYLLGRSVRAVRARLMKRLGSWIRMPKMNAGILSTERRSWRPQPSRQITPSLSFNREIGPALGYTHVRRYGAKTYSLDSPLLCCRSDVGTGCPAPYCNATFTRIPSLWRLNGFARV